MLLGHVGIILKIPVIWQQKTSPQSVLLSHSWSIPQDSGNHRIQDFSFSFLRFLECSDSVLWFCKPGRLPLFYPNSCYPDLHGLEPVIGLKAAEIEKPIPCLSLLPSVVTLQCFPEVVYILSRVYGCCLQGSWSVRSPCYGWKHLYSHPSCGWDPAWSLKSWVVLNYSPSLC